MRKCVVALIDAKDNMAVQRYSEAINYGLAVVEKVRKGKGEGGYAR